VERECGVKVYGYMPNCPECALESRHLGLVTAQEVDDLRNKMQILAAQAEKSIDLEGLIELMQAQNPIEAEEFVQRHIGNVRIAVARDKAFCFYYRDNLEMLEEMGAEIVPFSPIGDEELPDCDGLILGGGYPELYLDRLSQNTRMLQSIRNAILNGLPTVAECGGFMYLTDNIGGHPMVGAIETHCYNAKKLQRFGYTTISAEKDSLLFATDATIRAHEFHYWDAESPGSNLISQKPSGKSWKCAYTTDTLYAGYPHLYFPSNPEAVKRFIQKCLERKMRHEADGN
jgi:cobyrinic acid a,c-diamide synthase